MRKWAMLFFFISALCFFGCQKKEQKDLFLNFQNWIEGQGKLRVLSTTAMIGDLVSQIGGEKIVHLSLIVGDLDPHSYELMKGDDEKIRNADLIFYNGLGLEHGASIKHHLEKNDKAVALGDFLLKFHENQLVKIDGQIDPHIWMDITLFAKLVDPIVENLSQKLPLERSYFEKKGKEVKERLLKKDLILFEKIQQVPQDKRFLVTSHDAYHYFCKRYLADDKENDWIFRVQAPEGLAPDGQMSVLDIRKVSDFLCKHQISVVFPESNINSDALRKIIKVCQARKHRVRIAKSPLYGDSMGTANSYLEMIEHNIDILVSHFLREQE